MKHAQLLLLIPLALAVLPGGCERQPAVDTTERQPAVDPPKSLGAFFDSGEQMNDALGYAANGDLDLSVTTLRAAIRRASRANRKELDGVFPSLGTQFHENYVTGAEIFLEGAERLLSQGDEAMSYYQQQYQRSTPYFLRWEQWWGQNGPRVLAVMAEKYNLDTR